MSINSTLMGRLCHSIAENTRRFLGLAGSCCIALSMCACGLQHFTIAQPKAPAQDPSSYYSDNDYSKDLATYKDVADPTNAAKYNLSYAKQLRNDITYGLMSQIDVVYGAYYNHLFVYQSAVAIGSDSLTLGMTAAAAIATNKATKTIFSALGTGLSGVGLSTQKNLFAQQAFPAIGLAMETRRDSLRTQIIANLSNDISTYPLNAAKRDLVAYLNAGTLPGGLQEIQSEAGSANAKQAQQTTLSPPLTAPSNATAVPGPGDQEVSLAWTSVAGADSYNIYFANSAGVTLSSGTKISGVTTDSYVQSGLRDGAQYFYVITAVKGTTESGGSGQVSATPAAPPAGGAAPANLIAVPGVSSATLLWSTPAGATSFHIYFSKTSPVTSANRTEAAGPTVTSSPHTVTGLDAGTPLYFVVTAVSPGGESSVSNEAKVTPQAPSPTPQKLILTSH